MKAAHLERKQAQTKNIALPPILETGASPLMLGGNERNTNGHIWDLCRDGVTQGLIARFLACPERHRLGTVRGLSPLRMGGPLAFGSVFHDALDKVYSDPKMFGRSRMTLRRNWDRKLSHILPRMEKRDKLAVEKSEMSNTKFLQMLEENYGLANVVLREYFRRWEDDFYDYEWVNLEQVFDVPYFPSQRLNPRLVAYDPIRIRGKLDGVIRCKGKLWLFETKTKSRIEEEQIVDRLGYDLQVMLYLWAMERVYGERPVGVIYNVVRRPQLQQGQSTLKDFIERVGRDIRKREDFYFVRYQARLMDDERDRWESEFDAMMLHLIAHTEGAFHYRNPLSCAGRLGICEFFPICSGRTQKKQDGSYSTFPVREHVFPELEPGESE